MFQETLTVSLGSDFSSSRANGTALGGERVQRFGKKRKRFYPPTAIQTVGEGARLAGGRSGETRGIGRRNGGVLRRVAAVS
jgi:hypothetical protein